MKTVKCVECGTNIDREQAEGVSGTMDLFNPTAGIKYRTFRCKDRDDCTIRQVGGKVARKFL